jgi:hypothetical protein
MSRATFWLQLSALLKRNWFFKIRYRRTTCEVLDCVDCTKKFFFLMFVGQGLTGYFGSRTCMQWHGTLPLSVICNIAVTA